MRKIEWLETFELRVPEIDGDHRAILDLMKAVESAAQSGNREKCVRYVDRLLTFTHEHFVREQGLLKSWGYRDLDTHIRYHDDLYARAQAVKKACSAIESPQGFEERCQEMMSFLIDDIVRGDLVLKSFFQEAGLALPA